MALSFVFVPDIAEPNAFDSAVSGDNGVTHTAAPVFYISEVYDENLLKPAVNGTVGLLQSVYQFAPQVERVVLTSSFSAIVDPSQDQRPGYTYTEKEWNEIILDMCQERPRSLYSAAKTFAEKAAWNFMDEKKSDSTLATVRVSFKPIPAFADVRDVAMAHLKAFEHASGGRFVPSGGKYTFQGICEILRVGNLEYQKRHTFVFAFRLSVIRLTPMSKMHYFKL